MVEKTRREMELDGLYELRNNLIALKRRKDEYDDICAEQALAKADVVYRAENRTDWLPVDYEENFQKSWYKIQKKDYRRKIRIVKWPAAIIVLLLGLKMASISWDFFPQLYLFPDIHKFLMCSLTVALVVFCLVTGFLYEPEGICLILNYIITFFGFVYAIDAMLRIDKKLALLPIVMLLVTVISKIIVNKTNYREKNPKERQKLKEMQALDAKNKKENADRYAVIFLQETNKAAAKLQNIEMRRAQSEADMKALEKKINNNGWLYGDDIQWADKVAGYIQSRRADSIKEALRLVDMEQERARQRKLDEQRHKEIMEELEYQSWEVANARAEQREAAERAEKALRDSEAAAERARYDAEMRAYEEARKEEQHRQNVEWELRKLRDG